MTLNTPEFLRGRLLLPRKVRKAERDYLRSRRQAAGVPEPANGEALRVGLALSGGGIRSATFNLGVLQRLAVGGAFKFIDYMSTVSGGGYIGSCLSSLLSRLPANATMPFLDRDQVHHLRKHGDFLIVRRRMLSIETLRAIGNEVSNMILSLLVFIMLALTVAAGIVGYTWLIAGDGMWGFLWSTNRNLGWRGAGFLLLPHPEFESVAPQITASLIGAGLMALISVGAYSARFGRIPNQTERSSDSSREEQFLRYRFNRIFFAGFALACLLPFTPFYDRIHSDAASPSGAAELRDLRSEYENRFPRPPGQAPPVNPGSCCCMDESGTTPAAAPATGPGATDQSRGGPTGAGSESERQRVPVDGHPGWLLIPAFYFLGARIAALVAYPFFARGKERWSPTFRSVFASMQAIALYSFYGALLFAITPFLVAAACRFDAGKWYGPLSAFLSLLAGKFLLPSPATAGEAPSGTLDRLLSAARGAALNLLVVVLVFVTLIGLSSLIVWNSGGTIGVREFSVPLVAAALAFLALGILVNFNRVSPHTFYRDRLGEAYLKTDGKAGETEGVLRDHSPTRTHPETVGDSAVGEVVLRDDRMMNLVELHDNPGEETRSGSAGPYHLIVCALNLAGSNDLTRRTRKSDHFLFSKYYCGSTTTGYVQTKEYRDGRTDLARAMTISGAAASPAMGYYTNTAAAFLMTVLNARLGQWMTNPGKYTGAHEEEDPEPPAETKLNFFATKMRQIQKSHAALLEFERAWEIVFWPKWLFHEMMAQTDAEREMVHLSDGGHTGDNVGIYPLLQRRCDIIIASDAGCDPGYAMAELSAAIQMINIDENIKVTIDPNEIRPKGDPKLSTSHIAIGKIDYPQCTSSPESGDPDLVAKTGYLIYLKTSVTGDEAVTVRSYRDANPAFPHQTTADQFFDDDQFEAYRALGEHVAGALPVGTGKDPQAWMEWCGKQFKKADTSPPSRSKGSGGRLKL
ncbi:MAG: patatin-like phospholipase family protein [Acidobacteria bacterium]|nr:patatin-like phospholipase family protein [Acidobacteriota bacterium]